MPERTNHDISETYVVFLYLVKKIKFIYNDYLINNANFRHLIYLLMLYPLSLQN